MSQASDNKWESVIGLEIHIQLATQSKLFSGAEVTFGSPPNTVACAVDLGLPGTLPVVNTKAYDMAIQLGLALEADINSYSIFERKNYFYPDLPKGYQTSQLQQPIIGPGRLVIDLESGVSRTVKIHHAHLEEDAGKSLHQEFKDLSGIDLNRAGTALIEVVTEPDMRSSVEAATFMRQIHAIVTYLGISDGDMSQGSMRCDANVSVRPQGELTLGTRTELKNINSFRFVEKAIDVEIQRQIDLIEDGGQVIQQTRLYDADKNETHPMRSKEVAHDYRYFPCPDLLPVFIEKDRIDTLRQQLPELPKARQQRFIKEYQLKAYDANFLTQSPYMADYFENLVSICKEPKLSANWIMSAVSAKLNKLGGDIRQCPVLPEQLGQLISFIKKGTISGKIAKNLFTTLWEQPSSNHNQVASLVEAKGLKQLVDSNTIEQLVAQVIAEHPDQVDRYRQSHHQKKTKMIGFFVGQVMALSKGQANPKEVNSILQKKLK